jgi:drug/metabolite transporter (DMT)-like permease
VVLVPLFSSIPALRPPGAHPPRWNAYFGAALAFAGILLLTAPTGMRSHGQIAALDEIASLLPDFSSINWGDVLTFGCAIGFTFHCIALSHVSPRIPFQPLALLQIGFCAVFMAISLPIIERPQIHFTPRLIVALAIASALATAAAFSIQSWAQSILPSTHIALLLTMEPVFAWMASFIFTGERLGMRAAVGALLILAGIACAELVPQSLVPSAHEA